METKVLLNLVAEILEVDVKDLSLGDQLEALDWDSLSNISFIAEIDERVGVELDANQLAQAETIQDLQTLVNVSQA